MEKLELKHLSGYLPYALKVLSRETIFEMDVYSNMRGSGIKKIEIHSVISNQMKPILRPISDLTKEIEVNGEKFVPIYRINYIPYKSNFIHPPKQGICDRDIDETLCFAAGGSWEGGVEEGIDTFQFLTLYNKLYEWHFDVFGLIEKGLAIDINTLRKQP